MVLGTELMGPRASVVFAVQSWLGESDTSSSGQPGIMSVGMSCEYLSRVEEDFANQLFSIGSRNCTFHPEVYAHGACERYLLPPSSRTTG